MLNHVSPWKLLKGIICQKIISGKTTKETQSIPLIIYHQSVHNINNMIWAWTEMDANCSLMDAEMLVPVSDLCFPFNQYTVLEFMASLMQMKIE